MNELLNALEKLSEELHKNRKLDVKKDFSLMLADSHARKLIHQYKEATKWKLYIISSMNMKLIYHF